MTLHLYKFVNGGAVVKHSRASDLEANRAKEAPGIVTHEEFWRYIWSFTGHRQSVEETYLAIAGDVAEFGRRWRNPYFTQTSKNMQAWVDLVWQAKEKRWSRNSQP